jgi:XTP/dITP diphosphohydrolase
MPTLSTIRVVTTNSGKVREFRAALGSLGYRVLQVDREYPEIQADDFEEIARFGVDWLRARGLRDFVLEDAGLEVRALRGFPGVYSKHALLTVGCEGILRLLRGESDHRAQFVSVVAGVVRGKGFAVRGTCEGSIAARPRGRGGFGFDPIFIPRGETRTFAQMAVEEKNAVSHRGAAVRALARRLSR